VSDLTGPVTADADHCHSRDKKEAVGSITPSLDCWSSTKNSSIGAGDACVSTSNIVSGVFTSMQSEPQ
jgi:hypothetical protein